MLYTVLINRFSHRSTVIFKKILSGKPSFKVLFLNSIQYWSRFVKNFLQIPTKFRQYKLISWRGCFNADTEKCKNFSKSIDKSRKAWYNNMR